MRTKVTIYEALQGNYAYSITTINSEGKEFSTGMNGYNYATIVEAALAAEAEIAKYKL